MPVGKSQTICCPKLSVPTWPPLGGLETVTFGRVQAQLAASMAVGIGKGGANWSAKKYLCLLFFLSGFTKVYSQSWQAVGGGVNRHVRALYADTLSNELYLGGAFKYAGGQAMNGIAKWNGTVFSPLGAGSDNCDNYTCPGFLSVIKYKDEIYCSSLGFSIGGVLSKSIVRWNEVEWDSVGGGIRFPDGSNGIVWEQLVHQDMLYMFGVFYLGGNVYSPGIIKWDGQEFFSMGFPYAEPLSDQPPWIFAGVFFDDELYVGGQFSNGPNTEDQIDIAKFDGQTWHPVGGGIKGTIGDVNDLFVYKDELYVCGNFRKSYGNAGNGIMKLKDGAWVDVGGSFDEETVVAHQMLEYHGDMYVFGTFNFVGGGIEASNVAKWDGEKWCGLPNEFDQRIERAIVFKDSIFIGGWFNYIDGDSLPYLAKWHGDYVDTCGMVVGTEISHKAQAHVTFSPNPAQSHASLYLPNTILHATLTLYIPTAQPVLTQHLTAGNNLVSLEVIVTGLYFYEVRDEGRLLGSGKLVRVE